MPTTTALSAYNIFNLGTVDPTWTAAQSCTTDISDFRVVARGFPRPGTRRHLDDCNPRTYDDCIPHAGAYDSTVMADISAPTRGFHMPYYSPASECPDGFTTAGVAEKSGRGSWGNSNVTGAFSATEFMYFTTTRSVPYYNPKPNILLEAMGPGQTAVLCCPSGFTADPMGDCYQTIPPEDWPLTPCDINGGGFNRRATITYNGETIYGEGFSVTATASEVEFETSSWVEGDVSVILPEILARSTGYTYFPMLTLVHGEPTRRPGEDDEDESNTARPTASDGSSDDSSETGDAEAEESSPNAAPVGHVSLGAGAGLLVATWGVASVVGGLLMARL